MDIMSQRHWTHEELRALGFHFYRRKKAVILARELPPNEAPKIIQVEYDTLVAPAGYIICYDPDDERVQPTIDDYPQRPVEPQTFHETHRPWDEQWTPTPAEQDLLDNGCVPYYKVAGVWAKQVTAPTRIKSNESVEAITVPVGGWVLIGGNGEPYATTDSEFWERYERT
jgi:hypothetical protein